MLVVIVLMYVMAFVFGCVPALIVTWLAYRSRFGPGLATSAAILGGTSAVLMLGFVSRMNALSACVILAGTGVAVGLLVGVRLPSSFRGNST